MLEQAIFTELVHMRREVVQSQVVDNRPIGSDGILHALVPYLHLILLIVHLPVCTWKVDPSPESVDVSPQMGD